MALRSQFFIRQLVVVILSLISFGHATILCSSIPLPTIQGVQTLSISAEAVYNDTTVRYPGGTVVGVNVTSLNYCEVNITYTHPNVGDTVQVEYLLPLTGWNGRFLSTGGGGYEAGSGTIGMLAGVAAGYAAGTTNIEAYTDPSHPDQGLFTDFAGRALYEMTLFGQELCGTFYNSPPHHTYWSGCSTGGRQGHQMAQRYPEVFDGILAGAPAVMWTPVMMTLEWTLITMVQHNHFLTTCEINIFLNAILAQCDALDGVVDSIISDPDGCHFNPDTLVGKTYTCDGQNVRISQSAADVTQSLHDGIVSPLGKRLWTGYEWGTNWTYILPASVDIPGAFSAFGTTWISTFLEENANYNASAVTTEQLLEFWIDSTNRYGGLIDTSDSDYTLFNNAGGKILTFQGLADYGIPPNNTLFHRNLVENSMGGYTATNEFYRIFFAPGMGHCAAGYGPAPVDELDKLVAWVEQKVPPTTLTGSYITNAGAVATRPLCLWPQVAKYTGGDQNSAASYHCSSSF